MASSVDRAGVGAMNCLRQFGRLYMLPRDWKESTRDLAVAAAAAAAPSIRQTVVQKEAVAARPTFHGGNVLKAAAVGPASSSRGEVPKEAAGPPRQAESWSRGVVVQAAAGAPRKPSSTPASSARGAVVQGAATASSTCGAVVKGAATSSSTRGAVVQESAAEAPGTASSTRGASVEEASCGTASAATEAVDAASVTATASAAVPAVAPNAASLKKKGQNRKLTTAQKKVQFLQEIRPHLPEGPLKILDQSLFRQIAEAVQEKRGTAIDFTQLTGEECLRQVLPPDIKVGRGKLGLYRASRDFFRLAH